MRLLRLGFLSRFQIATLLFRHPKPLRERKIYIYILILVNDLFGPFPSIAGTK